jgi:hypothetical protein
MTTEPFIIKMIHTDTEALNYITEYTFFHNKPYFVFSQEQERLFCEIDQLEQQKYVVERAFRPYEEYISDDYWTNIDNLNIKNMPISMRKDFDILVNIRKGIEIKTKECLTKYNILEEQLRNKLKIPNSVKYSIKDHRIYLQNCFNLDNLITRSILLTQEIYELNQKMYKEITINSDILSLKLKLDEYKNQKEQINKEISKLQLIFMVSHQSISRFSNKN